ncbi:hypothetical protein [Catellatospora tritici]|uniref:hypothetical protein n=1 Tax=Catellatospora tritici TaxID=2851566 RepID=UPI001C2D2FD1|nr:hypothetical protein [Catellatospora tritici]MBV1855585.1 hypothetical protein [Catellatospora tritici]
MSIVIETFRHGARRGAAIALAVVATLSLATACSEEAPSPVGAWQTKVQTSLPSSGEAKITFNADGTLVQDGTDTLPGTGFWQKSTDGKITFQVVIPLADATKENIIGTIRGEQTATLKDGTYTSKGISTLYDLKGNKTKSFEVNLNGTLIKS